MRVCFTYREINGGSCIAMLGDKCVAIACDLRLGNQALTVNCNFEKVQWPQLHAIYDGTLLTGVLLFPSLRCHTLGRLSTHARARVTAFLTHQVFEITPRTYAGFPGLASDTLTV